MRSRTSTRVHRRVFVSQLGRRPEGTEQSWPSELHQWRIEITWLCHVVRQRPNDGRHPGYYGWRNWKYESRCFVYHRVLPHKGQRAQSKRQLSLGVQACVPYQKISNLRQHTVCSNGERDAKQQQVGWHPGHELWRQFVCRYEWKLHE